MKLTTRIWHIALIKVAKFILCWQGKNFPPEKILSNLSLISLTLKLSTRQLQYMANYSAVQNVFNSNCFMKQNCYIQIVIGQHENNTMPLSYILALSKEVHCKCFVCRNRRRLSAIQIQKQTLAKSTDVCV